MAVPTKTSQTYNVTTIREDISDVVDKITPTETPFYSAISKGKAKNTYHQWSEVSLDAASDSNAVVEGADADNDDPNNAVKLGNYCQLSDKTAQVSTTNDAVDGVGDVQTMDQQVALKSQALKLDMEKQMLSNKAANGGNASTARVSASFISFLRSNVSRGSGGANPTLSDTTTGYPNAAPTDGTQREFTEALFKDVMQLAYDNGGKPSMALMGSYNKRVASGFTGNATRYKDVEDKKIVAAVDIYVSDFGSVSLAPSRHIRTRDCILVDPSMVSVDFLQKFGREKLAKTGHSNREMVSVEYTLKVRNEKAHGHVADLTTSAS